MGIGFAILWLSLTGYLLHRQRERAGFASLLTVAQRDERTAVLVLLVRATLSPLTLMHALGVAWRGVA